MKGLLSTYAPDGRPIVIVSSHITDIQKYDDKHTSIGLVSNSRIVVKSSFEEVKSKLIALAVADYDSNILELKSE